MYNSNEIWRRVGVPVLALFLLSSGAIARAGNKAGGSAKPLVTVPAKVAAPTPRLASTTPAPSGLTSGQLVAVHRARVIFLDPFWFDPFWYEPYWHRPYVYPYEYENPTTGTLKFRVDPEGKAEAQVYINGGLASEFKHKHSLRLDPGEYRIEVRKPGYQSQTQTVHVIAGETLRLDFTLSPNS